MSKTVNNNSQKTLRSDSAMKPMNPSRLHTASRMTWPVFPSRIAVLFNSLLLASFLITLFLLTCSTANAQLGYTVELLYPQIGQTGTTVDVTIEGRFLDEPQEVLFYQRGIRCTKLEPIVEAPQFQTGAMRKVDEGQAAKLTFEIAKDAKPGEYQLRIRTRDNLSELMTFWVTPFPVVHETHPWMDRDDNDGTPLRNDSAKHAQAIPLNSTVCGYLPAGPPQDDDWYSVECKAGQRLSVEVIAARLGTHHYDGMNDPAVSIHDDQGQMIGRNDDNALHTQDPVLSVMIPRDGHYLIHMRQQMDYETTMRHYAMHVGTFARPLVAFPLGGQAGKHTPITLIGDAAGALKSDLLLPSNPGPFEAAFVDVFAHESFNGQLRATAPSSQSRADASSLKFNEPQPPTPNRIHTAPWGDVFEAVGHNSPDNPQTISQSLPLAINGRIEAEGEVDWYRFTASQGERYRVRTYGKTLDSELDARVWIRPAPGNSSKRTYDEDDTRWEPHDLVGHHYREQIKDRLDPIFMFEPDADGEWLIGIGDTRREFGPRHVYRVEFQPHVDSAFVFFPAYPSQEKIVRERIVLFPGHCSMRPMGVQPGLGSNYDGPLQLRAKNLPRGVTIEAAPFTQNAGVIPVMFSAAHDAEIGAELIDLAVEPVDPHARQNYRGGFVQVLPATQRRGGYAMYFDRTRKLALSVVEGAAFDLAMDRPAIPLVRNGELALNVRVTRHAGFDGDVYCEMDWLPEGVGKQPPLIIPAGQTEAIYKLRATTSATPGEYPISITGRENDGGVVRTGAGFHYVGSPFVTLTVGEPYVTIRLARAAIERETIGEISAEVTPHKPFAGEATLRLGRLPFGVEQVEPFPTIKASDRSATFRVKVTPDCLVGQYKDIVCEITVNDGGQQIRQQSGSGTLRVDPSRGSAER